MEFDDIKCWVINNTLHFKFVRYISLLDLNANQSYSLNFLDAFMNPLFMHKKHFLCPNDVLFCMKISPIS